MTKKNGNTLEITVNEGANAQIPRGRQQCLVKGVSE